MRRATGTLIIALALGCAGRAIAPEIVALEKLRKDPSLAGPEGRAFELLAVAHDLRLRARGEWDHHQDERARRDAIMGQIKMKTALAILAGEFARSRTARLDAELVDAQADDDRLGQELAMVEEEIAIANRLRTMTAQVANERKTVAQQLEATKKQAASDRQKLMDQLAVEKRHLEALEAIRLAELTLKGADTVDAPRFAKVKYAAATAMLQDAHKQFDAGKWDDAVARALVARTEATTCADVARPSFEQAERVKNTSARDRALEAAASALPGIAMRLEREKDLQRLVLVLSGLFANKQSTLLPSGAKSIEGVKDLLTAFSTYPFQVVGFTDDQGKPPELAALALARANTVYWALVTRGIDPKRMTVDGKRSADPLGDNASPSGRAANSRVEIAILYHVFDQ